MLLAYETQTIGSNKRVGEASTQSGIVFRPRQESGVGFKAFLCEPSGRLGMVLGMEWSWDEGVDVKRTFGSPAKAQPEATEKS